LLTGTQLDSIKLALPKGSLLPATAALLKATGLEFPNYNRQTRFYRLQSASFPGISAKMFQDKDIPIQVAVGNYDLGICSSDWIEELLARYTTSALVKLTDLGYGKGNLYLAASRYGSISSLQQLADARDPVRLVSEYPNLAEACALSLRLRKFKVFPVWGAAEAYPPENADLVLLWAKDESEIKTLGLLPLKSLSPTSAFLIANRESWQKKDMSQAVSGFSLALEMEARPWLQIRPEPARSHNNFRPHHDGDRVWLALPDGHQLAPSLEFIEKAGLKLEGYTADSFSRRPASNMDWLNVKVIRPQDMPLQVANGNFDLAVTGKDWLLDHLTRFPSSPAMELVELGFGKVTLVAVVAQDLPAADIDDLKQLAQTGKLPLLRVASEYINIADKYLHDNHVSRYKLIPTWGASEALLPEDADLLIENTQTGKTLAQHNLKIVDTLCQSSACLVGNKGSLGSPAKVGRIALLVDMFRRAAPGN